MHAKSTSRHHVDASRRAVMKATVRQQSAAATSADFSGGSDVTGGLDRGSDSENESTASGPAVAYRAQTTASFDKTAHSSFWCGVGVALQLGDDGPALSRSALHGLAERARGVCALSGGSADNFWLPCKGVLVRHLPNGRAEGLCFTSGNCVVLYDGRYAQVVIPVFSGGRQAAHRRFSFVVNILTPPSPSSTYHPEAAELRWFARDLIALVGLTLVRAADIECSVLDGASGDLCRALRHRRVEFGID
ncbi:hypothetical protein M885DRAFT_569995 [Pelagophyceae sp. CCMP2097]|nr:hypothetical protein M885DRAFT_569995 [Pelagophyceae sp. CCMP2097]